MANNSNKNNEFNFRRQIHRIEKGLLYPIQKSVFAEDYILQTVQVLKQNELENFLPDETEKWGHAVLEEYFKSVQHSPIIKQAYTIFQRIGKENTQPDWIPYVENVRPSSNITYNQFCILAKRRRSVRFFRQQPVPIELIQKAMEIALQSPSACNRQSYNYLFFTQKDVIQRLSQIPGGISGYEVPSLMVILGCYDGYFSERDFNAPVIDSMLAAMAFLFALETLGLSSVCINWPNVLQSEERVREVIDLRSDEFIVMMIGIGYAEETGKIAYSAKRSVDNVLLVNQRIKQDKYRK